MFIEDEGAHVGRKKNPQHPFFPYVATPFLPYVRKECFFWLFSGARSLDASGSRCVQMIRS